MPNILELLVRLENRVIALETQLGIEANPSSLIHPKALSQAKARAVIEAAKQAEIIKEKP
jgi:hypothetical protein